MAKQNGSANESNNPAMEQPVNYTILAKLVPLAFFIVLVNSLVVALFWKRPRLRTPQNHFLLGLASSDLLTGLLNIPLFIVIMVCPGCRSDFAWFLLPVCHNFSAVLAAYQILAITAERYLAIRKPLKHRSFGNKKARWVLAAIWLVSAVISFFPFFFYDKRNDRAAWRTPQLVHTVFCIIAVFLLPYAFMIYAQCLMFKTISLSGQLAVSESSRLDEERYQEKAKRDRKCLVIFASMAIIYAICWLPWFVISLLLNMEPFGLVDRKSLGEAPQVFAMVRYLSSIINPLIYTFFKRDFLQAFKVLILRKPGTRTERSGTVSERLTMKKRHSNP